MSLCRRQLYHNELFLPWSKLAQLDGKVRRTLLELVINSMALNDLPEFHMHLASNATDDPTLRFSLNWLGLGLNLVTQVTYFYPNLRLGTT